MKEYQNAILSVIEQKPAEHYRTIPQALQEVHPKTLFDEMPDILADCRYIQEKLLEEILFLAQGSAYAKDHQLEGVTNLEQWRNAAQISDYDDYRNYIEAEMNGAEKQLFTGKTALFIATTGSTGQVKYFLESEAGNAAKQNIMTVRGLYMSGLLPVTLDMNAKNLTISNYAPVAERDDGKLVVRASGQTARNMRKKTGTMNLLPVEFWESPGISARDRDYMMAVYTLAETRFSKVFCNNLIHFGRILDRIVVEGAQMIQDISTGQFSVELLPEVREKLRSTFPANPERAEALQKLYNQKGCLITEPDDIAAIWPQFSMVSCWLSATVGRDAREVLRRLPSYIKCFDMGYGASESKLNIPTKLASATGVAAPFSCFYEFLPLDGGKPLCMWEVEVGKYYELLITTYSGLYRYNMKDIVQVQGFIGTTPNLIFCGKSGEYLQDGDNRIYGYQFADIIHKIERKYHVEFDVMQVAALENSFSYILEGKHSPDFMAIKKELDELTQREFGLQSRNIYVMKHTYKNSLFDSLTREDRGACGIKLPVVVNRIPEEHQIEKIV
ncbi:MAG: GH3 auxin-responsive promoter family protein [Peptococcaceae bacterium]|nr:GH3 auxin-responsive promoter family protein [Peptococcaceae bacterium]